MNNDTLLQPQEVEVWYALPAIRRELSFFLKQEGLEQKKIANIMGLTEAAVSQYINKKRGKDITFEDHLKKEIHTSAKAIVKNNDVFLEETQRILQLLRNDGTICKLHEAHGYSSAHCRICKGKKRS